MFQEHLRFSDGYKKDILYRDNVEELYKKALEMLKGCRLYGFNINPNNPKEIIAALYLLAEDYNKFHEKF